MRSLLYVLLLAPVLATAQVAHDGEADLEGHAAASTTHTLSGKTTAGTDRCGVVDVRLTAAAYSAGDPSSVTWNGAGMTQIGTGALTGTSAGGVRSFYIVNPPTAASDVVVTLSSGSAPLGYSVRSFSGCDQSTPVSNVNTATGTSTTPSVNITTSDGDMVADVVIGGNVFSGGPGSGQTEDAAFTDGGSYAGRTSREACSSCSSPVTMDHTLASSVAWAIQGYSINAAEGGGGLGIPIIMHHRRMQEQ